MNPKVALSFNRCLTLEAKGRVSPAQLWITTVELQENGKWLCSWSIEYLCEKGVAFGVDPIDAMITCFKIIGSFIGGTELDGITVWWKQPGDNGGFPKGEAGWPGEGHPLPLKNQ